MPENALTFQLKETCRITKARWSVWLRRSLDDWLFGASHGLTNGRRKALEAFISQPDTARWLAGALHSGRMRSRATGKRAKKLGAERIYLFPNSGNGALLLVGANELDKAGRTLFKILGLNPGGAEWRTPNERLAVTSAGDRDPAQDLNAIHQVVQKIAGLVDVSTITQTAASIAAQQFGYDLVLVLLFDERGEDMVAEGIGGEAAGDVEKEIRFPASDKAVTEILQKRAGILVQNTGAGACLPIPGRGRVSQMCIPLMDGERALGLVLADRSEGEFSERDLLVLESLAGVLSSVLMNALRHKQLQERIEAQKLAEQRLIQSAKLAAVGEMAAGVAHELNNPLTTIAGFTELVLDDLPKDAPQREDLELVLREARRARGVVRRLLDFSRQGESLKVLTDINEILGEVLALVHHLARATGVEVRFVPWDDLPPIRMDRGQMKQVVLNLVHNALQAMPHGGTLVLQTNLEIRDDSPWIVLQVVDTGEGIPEDVLPHIFEPFFTTKPMGSGTGLGLSISYNIVSDHGGFMEVNSQLNKGTAFTVWLPVEEIALAREKGDA